MKNLLIALLCFLSWNLCAQKSLILKPGLPESGKSLQITYSGKLAGPDLSIVAKIGMLDRQQVDTLHYTFKDGKLKGKLDLPDSACFVRFEIQTKDSADTNDDQGYYAKVYKKGKAVKGADYWLAHLLFFGKRYGLKEDKDHAFTMMENELSLHPELLDLNPLPYLYVLAETEKFTKKVDSLALFYLKKELQTGKSDSKCLQLLQVMSSQKPGLKDSLYTAITDRFPKGDVRFGLLFNRLMYAHGDQIPVQLEALRNAFPEKITGIQDRIDYKLAQYYRAKSDMERFNQYLNLLKNPWEKAEQNNEIAWEMGTKNLDLPIALAYSNCSNQILDSLVAADPKLLTDSYWKERYVWAKTNYLDTRSYIYHKTGRLAEALADEEQAVIMNGGSNTWMNEQYLKFLLGNGLAEKAASEAERFIQKESTPVLDSLYEAAFRKVYGADADFKAARLKLLKNAPDFSLQDMNGETVTLSALKGKIVILDFWATWCGPCRASFPGMQKALNALKDRQDVIIYFINTSESGSDETRRAKIQTLLSDNKFSFRVLLDESVNDNFKVRDLYEIEGIPTKIVIDKNGKIQNRLVGYGGNDDSLVKELTDLAEKLR